MSDELHAIPADAQARAKISPEQHAAMYAASVADPEAFWEEHGRRLDWIAAPTVIKNTTFEYPNVSIKWFEDGVLNVCANCVDRHLATRGDQTAIIWEGDDPTVDKHITYSELIRPGLPAWQRAEGPAASARATGSSSTCR